MKDTKNAQTEEAKKTHEDARFSAFLDRLVIFHNTPVLPIRKWMAVAGIILFIALVIAYYAVNGG